MFLQKETGSTFSTATLRNHTPIQQLQAEIKAYKTSPILEIDGDETPIYPVLTKLFRRYLCMYATSCTSEQQFSTSGNIVISSQSSLKPTKVNMLVFLAQNL